MRIGVTSASIAPRAKPFAQWSRDGDDEAAARVRELQHRGDVARRALLEAPIEALVTPIQQEDAYELSERIDEVLDRAKDTVRTAQALDWTPDVSAAEMGAHAHAAFAHLVAAISTLGDRAAHPEQEAESRDQACEKIRARPARRPRLVVARGRSLGADVDSRGVSEPLCRGRVPVASRGPHPGTRCLERLTYSSSGGGWSPRVRAAWPPPLA